VSLNLEITNIRRPSPSYSSHRALSVGCSNAQVDPRTIVGPRPYRVDVRTMTYRYIGPNPESLTAEENAHFKRQLHGLRRVRRDETTKVFVDQTWPYTESNPCPTCHSWVPRDSPWRPRQVPMSHLWPSSVSPPLALPDEEPPRGIAFPQGG
jgi:hypothetical protein